MENKKKRNVDEVIQEHENSGKYFEVEGLKTFALDYGTGETIVCIHGVPTSSFLYRKLLKALQDRGYRGISIDLPGLGLSARPEDFDYSFPGFTQFLLKAINRLEVKKFHLVVHDIGGPVGFALAAMHPDKILSLTILNTWIDVVNFKKPLPMRAFEKPILGEAELKMISHTTWRVMFTQMGITDTNAISDEETKTYVDLLKREDDGKAFLKIMRNFTNSVEFRETCYKAVQNVAYPVQAIWGDKDPGLTYEKYGKEIKKIAGLKKVQRLNASHFLQEESWSEIAEKLDTLAKGIEPGTF